MYIMNQPKIKWIVVFKTNNVVHISAIKDYCNSIQIPLQILDKQDSNYIMFGEKQLYVPEQFAKQLQDFIDTLNK